jgi:hypothetical protein
MAAKESLRPLRLTGRFRAERHALRHRGKTYRQASENLPSVGAGEQVRVHRVVLVDVPLVLARFGSAS